MMKKLFQAFPWAERVFDYVLIVLSVLAGMLFFVSLLHLLETFLKPRGFDDEVSHGAGLHAAAADAGPSEPALPMGGGDAAPRPAADAPPTAYYLESPPVDAGLPDRRPSFGKDAVPVPTDPLSELLQTPWARRVAAVSRTDISYEADAGSYNNVHPPAVTDSSGSKGPSTADTDSIKGDAIAPAPSDFFNTVSEFLEGTTENYINSDGNLSVAHFNATPGEGSIADSSDSAMEKATGTGFITTVSAGWPSFCWWLLPAASIIKYLFNI